MNRYKNFLLFILSTVVWSSFCAQRGKGPADVELRATHTFKTDPLTDTAHKISGRLTECQKSLAQAQAAAGTPAMTGPLTNAIDILCKDIAIDVVNTIKRTQQDLATELAKLREADRVAREKEKKDLEEKLQKIANTMKIVLAKKIKEQIEPMQKALDGIYKALKEKSGDLGKTMDINSFGETARKNTTKALEDAVFGHLFHLYAPLDILLSIENQPETSKKIENYKKTLKEQTESILPTAIPELPIETKKDYAGKIVTSTDFDSRIKPKYLERFNIYLGQFAKHKGEIEKALTAITELVTHYPPTV